MTTLSNTINRGQLLKAAQAGKLQLVKAFVYGDTDRGPKAVGIAGYSQDSDDTYLLSGREFKSANGSAFRNDDGTITLMVNHNCHYTLREVEGTTLGAVSKPTFDVDPNAVVTGPDDPKVLDFLHAWHESGREAFARSCPSSFAAGFYDQPAHEAKSSKDGKKFVCLDKGTSGMFMVEKATGLVFGIKGYGRVNRRRCYGSIEKMTADYAAQIPDATEAVSAQEARETRFDLLTGRDC